MLLDRIARGGMGEIYLASLRRKSGFEKAVAVKRILPHLADDAAFVRMFEAEARITALLNHPNIVHIYDFGHVEGEAYLAMEFVDGFDLRTLMVLGQEADRPMATAVALRIASDCAQALDYAHRRLGPDGQPLRIIHRDISPQNILLSLEGATKLTDFGLAKTLSLDTGSMSGMLKGKLAYMAPEQIRGEPLDVRADLFSLGAVLYEMLAGSRLYPGDLPVAELVSRVTEARYEPLGTLRPDLDPRIVSLVTRCLCRDPSERYPTAQALERALHELAMATEQPCSSRELSDYVQLFSASRRVVPEIAADGTVVSRKPIVHRGGRPASVSGGSQNDASTPSAGMGGETPDELDPYAQTAVELPPDIHSDVTGALRSSGRQQSARWVVPALLLLLAAVVTGRGLWSDTVVADWTQVKLPPKESPVTSLRERPVLRRVRVIEAPMRRIRRGAELRSLSTTAPAYLELRVAEESARCFAREVLTAKLFAHECGERLALPPGPYKVGATAPDFESESRDIDLESSAEHVVELVLHAVPKPCTIQLESTPSDARVTLDGSLLSERTPMTLSAVSVGRHELRVTAPNHQPLEREFECNGETPELLQLALSEAQYQVSIGPRHRVVGPGGRVSHQLSLGGVRIQVRVRVTGTGGRVRVNAQPYVAVRMGRRSLGDTPTHASIGLGRTQIFHFERKGTSLGRLRVQIKAVD